MASSIFCRFPQAQGLLPELCKSEKGKKKKSLIPTAIEGMILLAGFGTPVGKALGVDNSEGAESHWCRFYSSFLVMLVHFFSAVVRDACGVSHHSGTHQPLYSFIPVLAPQRLCSPQCPRPLPPGRVHGRQGQPQIFREGITGMSFHSGEPSRSFKASLDASFKRKYNLASFLALL